MVYRKFMEYEFDSITGKVRILPTLDSLNVNQRRKEMNLVPLEQYIYIVGHLSIK